MSNKTKWDQLSLSQKAGLIKIYVNGGFFDIDSIREDYNKNIENFKSNNTTNDNGIIIYPSVQEHNGTLVDHNEDNMGGLESAIQHKDTVRTLIPFAEWYTKNYKKDYSEFFNRYNKFKDGGFDDSKEKVDSSFSGMKDGVYYINGVRQGAIIEGLYVPDEVPTKQLQKDKDEQFKKDLARRQGKSMAKMAKAAQVVSDVAQFVPKLGDVLDIIDIFGGGLNLNSDKSLDTAQGLSGGIQTLSILPPAFESLISTAYEDEFIPPTVKSKKLGKLFSIPDILVDAYQLYKDAKAPLSNYVEYEDFSYQKANGGFINNNEDEQQNNNEQRLITKDSLYNYINTDKRKSTWKKQGFNGWTDSDLDYLYEKLNTTGWDERAVLYAIDKETNFRTHVKNPVSSAIGLAQLTKAQMKTLFGNDADKIYEEYLNGTRSVKDVIDDTIAQYKWMHDRIKSEKDNMGYGRIKVNLLAPNASLDSIISDNLYENSLTPLQKLKIKKGKSTYRDLMLSLIHI